MVEQRPQTPVPRDEHPVQNLTRELGLPPEMAFDVWAAIGKSITPQFAEELLNAAVTHMEEEDPTLAKAVFKDPSLEDGLKMGVIRAHVEQILKTGRELSENSPQTPKRNL